MNNVESFREYLLGHFPTLKLPKGKKYVEFPVYKGQKNSPEHTYHCFFYILWV